MFPAQPVRKVSLHAALARLRRRLEYCKQVGFLAHEKAARKFAAKTQRKAELRVTGSTSQAISGLPAHLHIFLALFRNIV